jgi:hypothetical protein
MLTLTLPTVVKFNASILRSIVYDAIGPIWGGATLVGRLSGIRTQSGQTKINNGLTA